MLMFASANTPKLNSYFKVDQVPLPPPDSPTPSVFLSKDFKILNH